MFFVHFPFIAGIGIQNQLSVAHRLINKLNVFLCRSPYLGPLLNKSSLCSSRMTAFFSGSFKLNNHNIFIHLLSILDVKFQLFLYHTDIFTYYTPADCWGCLLHSNKVVLMLMLKLYSFFWCVQSLVMVSYTVMALWLLECVCAVWISKLLHRRVHFHSLKKLSSVIAGSALIVNSTLLNVL